MGRFALLSLIVLGLIVASSSPRDRAGTAAIGVAAILAVVCVSTVRRHRHARRNDRARR